MSPGHPQSRHAPAKAGDLTEPHGFFTFKCATCGRADANPQREDGLAIPCPSCGALRWVKVAV